ncbi:hypothetical protein [Thiocystis violascens]|uniref:phosphoketolase family protein n=1 Tax=Thiocystis violascens TaxID=73141 RepID=UPI00022C2CE3|nr:hypothetical protein [Thiocystis violascens]
MVVMACAGDVPTLETLDAVALLRTHVPDLKIRVINVVADVIDQVSRLGPRGAYAKQAIRDKLIEHQRHIAEHGEDLPEVRDWKWL